MYPFSMVMIVIMIMMVVMLPVMPRTTTNFRNYICEKFFKLFFLIIPFITINIISDFWPVNNTHNQPGVFQFLQMLRYCCFWDRQFITYLTEKTMIKLCQIFQNSYSGRMPQSFTSSCYIIVSVSFFFLFTLNLYCAIYTVNDTYY